MSHGRQGWAGDVEVTGVAVALPNGRWGIETSPEEYQRVLGQRAYEEQLNFRADYGNMGEPWIVTPEAMLKHMGFDDSRPVVRMTLRVIPDPELDRQERLVWKLIRTQLSPNAEVCGGEQNEETGRWRFHIWIPDVERSMTVILNEAETCVEPWAGE
jgi:hypothetical protein